ncbi:glycosyltransferase family 2 protein [Pollutibacter soli]|uniref:glycosyltransferase family 2 protein n=1 Tax=Pollutibacter soli TaxID=3034157 RepID=UPI0030139A76
MSDYISSIDVVIPSFRMNPEYILPMLAMDIPPQVKTTFILVKDQPGPVPDSIRYARGNFELVVLVNDRNLGSAATRNRGMEAGHGDWVLFLDDDIRVEKNLLSIYMDAALNQPEEIGFIGLIELPPAPTAFAAAQLASGAVDIFFISKHKTSFAWAATASFMVRRSAVKNIRYSTIIPKTGGGEDVDFCFKIRENNGFKNFKTLPEAKAWHPWWNDGKPDLYKPFRYGIGNSWLVQLNPKNTYRDFFNTPETILIILIALCLSIIIKPSWVPVILLFTAMSIIIEFLANLAQVQKRQPGASLAVILYTTLMRLAQETGVVWGKIKRGRFDQLGLRFHYDGAINKSGFYKTNTYRIVKWILYPLAMLAAIYVQR